MCKMLSSPPPSNFLKIYSEIRKNIKSMLISQEIRNDILRFFPDNPPPHQKKKIVHPQKQSRFVNTVDVFI